MNAFELIRKRLEETRMTYFLTIANGGDERNDAVCEGISNATDNALSIVSEVEAEYAKSTSVLPWISIEEQEEPEENGNYLVTACLYNDPDKTKTEIVSFYGEWNIGNNWNIVAWCPQRIEEYKLKDKTKDAFLSR